jgi:hypothetical protein
MVNALARQTRLLRAHLIKAQTDEDYWGEVASKLRLLIVEKGANRALLLRVASAYEGAVSCSARPDADHPRTWDDLLNENMLARGANGITFRQVICRWAEQLGGAHEDWTIDEMLLSTQSEAWVNQMGKRTSLAHANVTAIALKVIASADKLIADIRQCDEKQRG